MNWLIKNQNDVVEGAVFYQSKNILSLMTINRFLCPLETFIFFFSATHSISTNILPGSYVTKWAVVFHVFIYKIISGWI